MSGDNIASIVKSPAFTILIATICVIVIMDRLPVVITTIKEIKKS